MEWRYARGVRRPFFLTVLTCAMTCWLFYVLGCCVPLTPYAAVEHEHGASSPSRLQFVSPSRTGEWEQSSSSPVPSSSRSPGPRQGKLRRDELHVLGTTRNLRTRHHRFMRKPLGGHTESTGDGVGDELVQPRPWYRRNMTASRKLPQALIIGVKKGGTRALLEFLRLHPDVRAVGPETHFFDRHYDRGLEWYRRQMPPTLEGQLTMEKTPSYFITKEVPSRIYNMSHDVKLLVVVRDPVTRAISDYAQTASKRRDMRSFDNLAFLNNTTGLVDTTWGAIKIGVYAKHLERWLQYFALGQFHFVSGENLIKDPAGEMARVQDFLGLRRVITENHFYFNETKGFPCLKKSEGNGSPRCLGKTKGRVHPSIDSSTIQRLRDFYRPFNLKFYQMTNTDFGWP